MRWGLESYIILIIKNSLFVWVFEFTIIRWNTFLGRTFYFYRISVGFVDSMEGVIEGVKNGKS